MSSLPDHVFLAEKRAKLLKQLNLPEHLTTNSIVTILNAILSWEEFSKTCETLFAEE